MVLFEQILPFSVDLILNGLGHSGKRNRKAHKVGPDEMAHIEPPHLDLHCLLSCSYNNFL